jgi:hypothetical protein
MAVKRASRFPGALPRRRLRGSPAIGSRRLAIAVFVSRFEARVYLDENRARHGIRGPLFPKETARV